jgi:hypothetical protein
MFVQQSTSQIKKNQLYVAFNLSNLYKERSRLAKPNCLIRCLYIMRINTQITLTQWDENTHLRYMLSFQLWEHVRTFFAI